MSNVKKFQKRKEDFVCEKCNHKIIGDGFTNHCPECFFSKHVDIFPGDRLEDCEGLMKPVEIMSGRKGTYILLHKCQKCGTLSKDKFREGIDNFDNLLEIVKEINKTKEF